MNAEDEDKRIINITMDVSHITNLQEVIDLFRKEVRPWQ
jgi:hypothetical protein